MKETEITVEVFDSLDNITSLLKEKQFKLLEEYDLVDYYYSKYPTDELKNFEYKDLIANSFLVRQVIDVNPKNLLTFKSKDLDDAGNVISEEKINCGIDKLSEALKIFNLSGLNCWCKLSQHLLIFKKGNIEFAVQIIDNLGIFIEYEEDDTMKDLNKLEKINFMINTLKSLGLKIGDDFSSKKVYLKFKKDHKF